jgi:hypothetical protein
MFRETAAVAATKATAKGQQSSCRVSPVYCTWRILWHGRGRLRLDPAGKCLQCIERVVELWSYPVRAILHPYCNSYVLSSISI